MSNGKINQMKIVLVQPSVEDFYFTPHRSSVLGLRSLAALWEKRGHQCQIVNFPTEGRKGKKISLPANLEYLRPYMCSNEIKKQTKEISDTTYFRNYYRFGSSIDACIKRIWELKPDAVAVSCFAWSYAEITLNLLKSIKNSNIFKQVLLITGGPGVTVMPEYFSSAADLVVSGEGENSIVEIERYLTLPESAERGRIIIPEPPDNFPFVWNLTNSRKRGFNATTMLTRGCPKMCSFCSNHLVFGNSLRKIDLKQVLEGIDDLIAEVLEKSRSQDYSDIKLHVNFEDDNILFYKQYFLALLSCLKEKCSRNKIIFTFTVENGIDYMLLKKDYLKQLKDLSLSQLNISLGVMDPEQLELERRTGSLEKLETIISYSKDLNIPVITYFICGLKGDTPEKVVDTITYLHGQSTIIGISLYYPVPGLSDWQDRELFKNIPSNLCCGSSAAPWNESLSTKELITAFRLARTSNYIKKSTMERSVAANLGYKLLQDKTLEKSMVERFFGALNDGKKYY